MWQSEVIDINHDFIKWLLMIIFCQMMYMGNNLLCKYFFQVFVDVTLSCEGGMMVRAHKVVLASCSPYFQVNIVFGNMILSTYFN